MFKLARVKVSLNLMLAIMLPLYLAIFLEFILPYSYFYNTKFCIFIGQCKRKSADCGLRTADCGLRTADCGPGVKRRLRVKCRLQTKGKMQARGKMQNEAYRLHTTWDVRITLEKLLNHSPLARDLQSLLVFFQHPGRFIEPINHRKVWYIA